MNFLVQSDRLSQLEDNEQPTIAINYIKEIADGAN